MKPPTPAICWVRPTLYQARILQPVDHSAERDGFYIKHIRDGYLRASIETLQQSKHAPLGTCHSHDPRPFVKRPSQQACGITQKKTKIVAHA
jgi:hypothetical protein